jgi:outer membrane PBP1 activator LpoA protein
MKLSRVGVLVAAVVVGVSLHGCDVDSSLKKAQDLIDQAAEAGTALGKNIEQSHGKAKENLESQAAELQKRFEPLKRSLEDEIGKNLEKAKEGAAMTAEKAKALKSQLVSLVLAAKGHAADAQKKVDEAGGKLKDVATEGLAKAQDAAGEGLAKAQTGVKHAGLWLDKLKGDMTSMIKNAKEAFDENHDGVIEMVEWEGFAQLFGIKDSEVVAGGDGNISDTELDKALAKGIEEKLKKNSVKNDECIE